MLLTNRLLTIVALPFQKRQGGVGCEALSSRPHGNRQSNNIGADDAETPPAGHAETLSDKQSTCAKILRIAASACNIIAGCCEQFSISSGYQSIMQQNGPTTCNTASKRKARSEGPRPRGPSGCGKNVAWKYIFMLLMPIGGSDSHFQEP